MPTYFPIDTGVTFEGPSGDVLAVNWTPNSLTADFPLTDHEDQAVRVRFDEQTIIRPFDEMAWSTEDNQADVHGLVSEHFAYRVEGAKFAECQSETWKVVCGPIQHYRFVTAWGCMDALSRATPSFEVVRMAE